MMDRRTFSRSFLLLTVGVLGSGMVFGAAAHPVDSDPALSEGQAPKRDLPWSINEITGDVGSFSHVAVAVDSLTGDVFVAYYVADTGDLWLARTVSQGGNCGPGNNWKCGELYTAGDVGKYCSIAVYSNPDGPADLMIPFYDATNEQLRYYQGQAYADYNTGFLGILDTGFMDTDRTGMYTAVQYDWNGNPWIAYQNETYGAAIGTHRMIARWRGDGNGNCGEGGAYQDWDCHDLLSNGFSQSFSSTGMAIDQQGRPVVAFYDELANNPVLAYYVGSGGSCGPSSQWRCYNIPPRPGDTDAGRHVVPFVADGTISVFYQNSSRQSLERATYVHPTAGNCGWSSGTMTYQWECETIDYMDGVFMSRGISVAADPYGYPIVTYQYGNDPGPGALAVARPVASPEVDSGGGCLPVAPSWSCDIIDGGGSYLDEAFSVSIATTSSGGKFIAYDEVNDYPFSPEHNLKLAVMPTERIFADNFECGDTSQWSVTVP